MGSSGFRSKVKICIVFTVKVTSSFWTYSSRITEVISYILCKHSTIFYIFRNYRNVPWLVTYWKLRFPVFSREFSWKYVIFYHLWFNKREYKCAKTMNKFIVYVRKISGFLTSSLKHRSQKYSPPSHLVKHPD